jgi:hypothetical protein
MVCPIVKTVIERSKENITQLHGGGCFKRERLEERRTRRKLQLLYNIQNGSTPSYLLDLIPPTIQSTTMYPLWNGNDSIVPFCGLSLTRDSFVSATVREWNNLNLSVRNLDTLSKFKKATRSSISMPIPRHYSYGPAMHPS